MNEKVIRDSLLVMLAQHYEDDSSQFLSLSSGVLASAPAQEPISGLRNEGYVEEQRQGDHTNVLSLV